MAKDAVEIELKANHNEYRSTIFHCEVIVKNNSTNNITVTEPQISVPPQVLIQATSLSLTDSRRKQQLYKSLEQIIHAYRIYSADEEYENLKLESKQKGIGKDKKKLIALKRKMKHIKDFNKKLKLGLKNPLRAPSYLTINNHDDVKRAKNIYFPDIGQDSFYKREFEKKYKQLCGEDSKNNGSRSSHELERTIKESGSNSWIYILNGERHYVQPATYAITSDCKYTINENSTSIKKIISGSTTITIAPKQFFLAVIAIAASILGVILSDASEHLTDKNVIENAKMTIIKHKESGISLQKIEKLFPTITRENYDPLLLYVKASKDDKANKEEEEKRSGILGFLYSAEVMAAVAAAIIFFNIYEYTPIGKKLKFGIGWRGAFLLGTICGLLNEKIVGMINSFI